MPHLATPTPSADLFRRYGRMVMGVPSSTMA
jgi:hypothetical protein